MKLPKVVLLGTLTVMWAGGPVVAGDHKFYHSVWRFIKAWNSHDAGAMAQRWTADARFADVMGRGASGRDEVARVLTSNDSTLKLVSEVVVRQKGPDVGVNERDLGRRGVVEFDAEVAGVRSADGMVTPAQVRRFTLELVWAPDLPGGHHPNGRYFISSMRVENLTR